MQHQIAAGGAAVGMGLAVVAAAIVGPADVGMALLEVAREIAVAHACSMYSRLPPSGHVSLVVNITAPPNTFCR